MGKEIHIASGFVAYTIFIIHSLQLIIRAIAKKSVQCCVDRFIILYMFCSREYANRIGFYGILNILINLISPLY